MHIGAQEATRDGIMGGGAGARPNNMNTRNADQQLGALQQVRHPAGLCRAPSLLRSVCGARSIGGFERACGTCETPPTYRRPPRVHLGASISLFVPASHLLRRR